MSPNCWSVSFLSLAAHRLELKSDGVPEEAHEEAHQQQDAFCMKIWVTYAAIRRAEFGFYSQTFLQRKCTSLATYLKTVLGAIIVHCKRGSSRCLCILHALNFLFSAFYAVSQVLIAAFRPTTHEISSRRVVACDSLWMQRRVLCFRIRRYDTVM